MRLDPSSPEYTAGQRHGMMFYGVLKLVMEIVWTCAAIHILFM